MKRQIDDKGRLEIPNTFLNNLNIKTNDYVDLILVDDVISLRKAPDDNLNKPQQVQGIDVTATSNTITLSWIYNKSDNIIFYIFKSESSNFALILNNPHQVTTLKRWTDFDVLPNKIYYYRIVACDNIGNYSLPSIVVSTKRHADEMPLRLKVDLEQKRKLAKVEIETQIENNEKNAEVLQKRLKKL